MNRYQRTFQRLSETNEKALIPFVTLGDPNQSTSLTIVQALIDGGADILELGFAFSEPVADGPTIQASTARALRAGTNTKLNFSLVKKIREYDKTIPIGILTYTNIIFQYGIDKFYKDASIAGIDSVLVADLPPEEAKEYAAAATKYKVNPVFIISPLTTKERLKIITKKTKGFAYVVSRLGVTGAKKSIESSTIPLLKRIRPLTNIPLAVGFGISNPDQVKTIIRAGADGAIVGSAIVKIIEQNLKNKRRMINSIYNFTKSLKKATR